MGPVDFSEFVDDLATLSGKAILPFFRSALPFENKSAGGAVDPVTEADRAAEAVMRGLIKRVFPGHGVIGEEFECENADAEFVWVLDPLDGTKAFIAGLPLWGTLIGLIRNQSPTYGMMSQPYTGERFFGDGGGSTFRGRDGERKLKTSRTVALGDATLSTTSPRLFTGTRLEAYDRVEAEVRLARYGYDCYAYCMLAAGHIDLVIEDGLKPYDIMALIPIIEGAGGVVTSWEGGSATGGGSVVAAANRRLHDAALRLLNP